MTTIELETMRDRIRGQIPMCPAPYVTSAIRQASRCFFQESEVWHMTVSGLSLVAGQASYEIVLPAGYTGSQVYRILEARVNGAVVSAGTYRLGVTFTALTLVDHAYLAFERGYIPTDSEEAALEITVVLIPDAVSGFVDPQMWLFWNDAVYQGARKILYSTPSQPWFNQISSANAQTEYAVQLAIARRECGPQFSYSAELVARNPGGWL